MAGLSGSPARSAASASVGEGEEPLAGAASRPHRRMQIASLLQQLRVTRMDAHAMQQKYHLITAQAERARSLPRQASGGPSRLINNIGIILPCSPVFVVFSH